MQPTTSSTPSVEFTDDSDTDLLGYMAMAATDPTGARAAFDEFYRRHAPELYRHLRDRRAVRLVARDDVEVEDFVQETFLRAFLSADTFEPEDITDPKRLHRRVQAWLGTIALNLVRDLCRTDRPELRVENVGELAKSLRYVETGDAEPEVVKAVEAFLEGLPERERDVMLEDALHYKPGVTHQRLSNEASSALARKWHTTPENIRAIRSRTKKALRAMLEQRFPSLCDFR